MKENKMSWQRKTCGKRLDSAKRIQICATWSFFKMALEIRNFKIQFKTYILAILQIFIVIQLLLKKFVWCVTLVRQFFVRIVHLDVLVFVCLYLINIQHILKVVQYTYRLYKAKQGRQYTKWIIPFYWNGSVTWPQEGFEQ